MADVRARHDDRAAQRREPARSAWAPATLSQPHAVIATLADSISDGLWILDADGQVILMNLGAERLLGWTSPELLGTLVHDRVHVHQTGATGPSAHDCPLLAVLQSRQSGSVGADLFRRKDGSMVPVAYTASPILSEGQVVGAVVTFRARAGRALPHLVALEGVARDITADKRTEDALQESEERFRLIADTAPVLLWMSGPDGLCTFFNKPWLDFTGRALEQEMGNGWAEGVHPDDFGRCLDTYRSAFDARRPFTMEYRLHHADGTYRWVLDTGVPRFLHTGGFAGYIGSAIDITERRRDEDAQRFLATATTVLTASLDYETTLQSLATLIAHALADACMIYRLAPDGALQQVGMAHVDPRKDALVRELLRAYPTDPDDPVSPLSRTLRMGRSELVPVVSDAMHVAQARDARHLELLRALNTTSLVAAPLVAHGRTIGVLACMATGDSRRYGPDDLVLIEELARRAALAVDNAHLYAAEQAARRAAELAAERTARLQAVTAALSEALRPGEVGDVVIRHSRAAMGTSAGFVMVLSEGGDMLEALAWEGIPPDAVDTWNRFPLADALPLAEAVRTGTPVWLETKDALVARYPHVVERERYVLTTGAWACLPLWVEGRAVGGLALIFATERTFGAEDRAFMLALARQCAQALERTRLYDALAERERRLGDLVGRLLMAQEEERRRVAYEVHDGLAQVAAGAYQHLDAFAQHHRPRSPQTRDELRRAVELARAAVEEARHLVSNLRPTILDDFGLAAAITVQVDELRGEGWQVSYDEALGAERLPLPMETALFRVAQEALTNVRKHAHGRQAWIRLERAGQVVRLAVEDWGRGFVPEAVMSGGGAAERVGLASMQQRVAWLGGQCTVESRPGAGTRVLVEVPLLAVDGGAHGA